MPVSPPTASRFVVNSRAVDTMDFSRTGSASTQLYVMFFIELGSRRVHFAGCTPNPTAAWVTQQARHVTWTLAEGQEAFFAKQRKVVLENSGRIDPERIPLDDAKTYEMLARGDSIVRAIDECGGDRKQVDPKTH